ncbi:MAG: hypothetical protein JSV51_08515 [Candidatus Bathyarchaeota archaeon]|nr:MAG: hypothetical protein JSV51_08515 [Candidatus Bathyarchaeota archaeon]
MVCPKCGSKTSRAGPLWIDEIANKDFITSMEKQARNNAFRHKKEIRKLLGLMKEEAEAPITYYSVDKICDKFGLPVPPVKKIISALEKIGYEINLTHFTDRGFKTNAPAKIIKEVITKLKH